MKFQIWCTEHDCAVIVAEQLSTLVLPDKNIPASLDGPMEFELDESNLYCTGGEWNHNFLFRVLGDAVLIDPPGKIVL